MADAAEKIGELSIGKFIDILLGTIKTRFKITF